MFLFHERSSVQYPAIRSTTAFDSEFKVPKFEVYENKSWSNNVFFINQYNNEMLNLFREFERNERE